MAERRSSSEPERRIARRRRVRIPLSFRILQDTGALGQMRLSSPAQGELCDLGLEGLGVVAEQIIVDGIHIGRVTDRHLPPRVFVEFELPGGRMIRAACRTIWCERIAGQQQYQLGLRFCELDDDDRAAIEALLPS